MKGKLRVSLLIEGDRLVSGTMVEVTKDMIDSGYVVQGSIVNAKKDDKSEVKAKVPATFGKIYSLSVESKEVSIPAQ